MNQQKYVVYRFHDAKQRLLYVSVSQRSELREIAYHSKHEWIDTADPRSTEKTWHATLEEANAARNAAIKTGRPLYNKEEPETVRKTTDIPGETQTGLRARLDDGATQLGIPTLAFQKYSLELLRLAVEDDALHQRVIDRLRDKLT